MLLWWIVGVSPCAMFALLSLMSCDIIPPHQTYLDSHFKWIYCFTNHLGAACSSEISFNSLNCRDLNVCLIKTRNLIIKSLARVITCLKRIIIRLRVCGLIIVYYIILPHVCTWLCAFDRHCVCIRSASQITRVNAYLHTGVCFCFSCYFQFSRCSHACFLCCRFRGCDPPSCVSCRALLSVWSLTAASFHLQMTSESVRSVWLNIHELLRACGWVNH